MVVVVSSLGGVIVHTLCFCGFFRVFVGGESFCVVAPTKMLVSFLKRTRTEVCCKCAKHQNVGFLLKHKSKDDSESMRGDSNDESKRKQRRSKQR